MIDAQSVHFALGDELEHQSVRRLEHRLVLHAQRRQIVDFEEAPVVDLVRRHAPVREPIGLGLEQAVQRLEALGIARLSAEARVAAWIASVLGVARAQPRQAPLVNLFVALAFRECSGSARGCREDGRTQRPGSTLPRARSRGALAPPDREGALEYARIVARVERKAMLVIEEWKGPVSRSKRS